jgi:hypothetical protein
MVDDESLSDPLRRARRTAKTAVLLAPHAFVIWLGCALTVAFGRDVLGLETALRLHAIVAPALAGLVSLIYFQWFHAAPPLRAATFFVSFAILLDATVVAPVFEKSYAMFSSLLGTWLPFLLIFLATYFTGIWITRRNRAYAMRKRS